MKILLFISIWGSLSMVVYSAGKTLEDITRDYNAQLTDLHHTMLEALHDLKRKAPDESSKHTIDNEINRLANKRDIIVNIMDKINDTYLHLDPNHPRIDNLDEFKKAIRRHSDKITQTDIEVIAAVVKQLNSFLPNKPPKEESKEASALSQPQSQPPLLKEEQKEESKEESVQNQPQPQPPLLKEKQKQKSKVVHAPSSSLLTTSNGLSCAAGFVIGNILGIFGYCFLSNEKAISPVTATSSMRTSKKRKGPKKRQDPKKRSRKNIKL
jgi:hypothetical protein